ncbi:LCI fold-containing protein, partial [Escherichia coli]
MPRLQHLVYYSQCGLYAKTHSSSGADLIFKGKKYSFAYWVCIVIS